MRGDRFRNRQIQPYTLVGKYLLPVERNRIIDRASDTGILQRLHDRIPSVGQERVLVVTCTPTPSFKAWLQANRWPGIQMSDTAPIH